jgi:hypothetical protein
MLDWAKRGRVTGDSPATLYLHYPCFDGVMSAALAWDFLETSQHWTIAHAMPVNYDGSAGWLARKLPARSAVVDFLYHPGAAFWADHHATTFLSDAVRGDFEARASEFVAYDREAASCAGMLAAAFGARTSDPPRYAEMAAWADKIDSAAYDSVREAISGTSAAAELNLSLSLPDSDGAYCDFLLRALRTMTLDELALAPAVRARSTVARVRVSAGLDLVGRGIREEAGDIAVFDVTPGPDDGVNRYSAFHFFPHARYSVGLVRDGERAKITAMRNPWIDFPSVELGEIFRSVGGGGHRRVASVVSDDVSASDALLRRLVDEIRQRDTAAGSPQALA